MDIWLEKEISIDLIESALQRAIPPGIVINEVEPIDDLAPSLQSMISAADYEVTLLEPIQALDEKVRNVQLAAILPRQRRGKAYDLRPLIHDLSRLPDNPNGNQRLHIILSARENATGRPEEVILALGGDPTAVRIHRTVSWSRQRSSMHNELSILSWMDNFLLHSIIRNFTYW